MAGHLARERWRDESTRHPDPCGEARAQQGDYLVIRDVRVAHTPRLDRDLESRRQRRPSAGTIDDRAVTWPQQRAHAPPRRESAESERPKSDWRLHSVSHSASTQTRSQMLTRFCSCIVARSLSCFSPSYISIGIRARNHQYCTNANDSPRLYKILRTSTEHTRSGIGRPLISSEPHAPLLAAA